MDDEAHRIARLGQERPPAASNRGVWDKFFELVDSMTDADDFLRERPCNVSFTHRGYFDDLLDLSEEDGE